MGFASFFKNFAKEEKEKKRHRIRIGDNMGEVPGLQCAYVL